MKAYRFPEYDTPIVLGGRGYHRRRQCGDGLRSHCLRLGAEESLIVYRRSRRNALSRGRDSPRRQEGVQLNLLVTP